MPFIFIDRRMAGRGKSSPNRQKLVRRVKSFIKTSLPQNIGQGGVTGAGAHSTSPVKITAGALEEPFFCYAKDGERTVVLIGNDEYDREDIIEIPEEDGGKGAGPGDHGEDDFVVNVARDEFLKAYFEDCELPNLTNEKYTEKLDNKFARAGFSTSGTPAQRSIIRTYKQMIGRRRALTMPYVEELIEAEEELEQLLKDGPDQMNIHSYGARIELLKQQIEELKTHIAALSGFDDIDVRYHKREAQPLKTVDAVLFMVMDISGSMTEEKKKIARRWFALLYAFIQQRHANTELVFIAHHDEAMEMSETDFFTTRINGGTTVSPAILMINKIVRERYDPNQTNIYVSHASDGDNWGDDSDAVVQEMNRLMPVIRFFSYVEVGKPTRYGWMGAAASSDTKEDTELWKTYDAIHTKQPKKMSLAIIEEADACYAVFKKVFKKASK
jgi:uncharacterized sporulation protein YeaH/YhbH (DUF444 family)